MWTRMKNFDEFLLEEKYLTETELKKAKKIQIKDNKLLDEVLIEEGIITKDKMIEILALKMGLPHVNLSNMYVSPEVVKLVPEYLARKYMALPIKKDGTTLLIALSDPLNFFAIDDLKLVTNHDIRVVIASKNEIQKAIEIYYNQEPNVMVKETENLTEELEEAERAPVISLVDT